MQYIGIGQFTTPITLALEIRNSADVLIGELVNLTPNIYHELFHTSSSTIDYETLSQLLSHPNSLVAAAATKHILNTQPDWMCYDFETIFENIYNMSEHCQYACIRELIYSEIPALLEPLIMSLGDLRTGESSRRLVLDWNSRLLGQAVKNEYLKGKLLDYVHAAHFHSMRRELIDSLCNYEETHAELTAIIKDEYSNQSVRRLCASRLSWHCRIVPTATNNTLLDIMKDVSIPSEVRIEIAMELDPDGENLEASLKDQLEDELMRKACKEDREEWHEYRATKEVFSSYNTDYSWTWASHNPISRTRAMTAELERLLGDRSAVGHYDSIPYMDTLSAIRQYANKSDFRADNFKTLVSLIELYQLVNSNKDQLSVWITPDSVFDTIVQVSGKMCNLNNAYQSAA